MTEGKLPEIPQPARLPPDPGPDIIKTLSEIDRSKPQSEGQAQDKVKQETEKFLGALPPELQVSLRGFCRDVAKNIVSQETNMNGAQAEIRVAPARVKYYEGRLKEVLDSGFLNPHISPQKKITE